MDKLEQILNNVRQDNPDPTEAAARVRRSLFGPGASGVDQIRGCDDFASLIPSYLQRTLSDARRMLLEDHVRECIPCRKALDQARNPKVRPMTMPAFRRTTPPWAIAAAMIVGIVSTGIAARQWLPYFDNSPRATVKTVDGMLYKNGMPAGEGATLQDGEEVRTPGGTRAVLRLFDGSRIEMNERARLSVTRSWRGTTIRLARGHIIVQAAKQKQGKLFVATDDLQVAVVGTIFSVNNGTQGSRVSVVEGRVQVDRNGRSESLKPGEQTTSSAALAKVPVASEVSWSHDSARYVALLGELNALQMKLQTIPSTGLRYQSRLLVYVPEDTQLFAAIPNLGSTLSQAKRIFDDRVRVSEVLRQWWEAPENAQMRRGVEILIDRLSELSSYVGDEIVVALTNNGRPNALLLAEVRSAGVKDALDRLVQETGAQKAPIVYTIQNNILIIAENPERLQQAQAIVARGGSPSTPFRQRLEQSYTSGAGWLMAANLEQIVRKNVHGNMAQTAASQGFNNIEVLTIERRDIAGKTENRATVDFSGPRRGIPSWLAAPGPMNTLSFISPDAGVAFGMVLKQPRQLLEEILQMVPANNSFPRDLAQFELATGVKVMDDLVATLGTEGTVAMDGPLFPVPSWKVVLELNSPQRLEASIEKIVEAVNRVSGKPPIVMTREQVGNRTFYKLTSNGQIFEVHYTFVDNFLVMAANRSLLTQAIQNRQTGNTLPQSEKFRSQLPYATNPNFSAVLYHNLGGTLGPIIDFLQNGANVTPAQRQSMQALKDSQPGVIGAYAESDRITAATNGNLLGLNLSMLTGARIDLPRLLQPQ